MTSAANANRTDLPAYQPIEPFIHPSCRSESSIGKQSNQRSAAIVSITPGFWLCRRMPDWQFNTKLLNLTNRLLLTSNVPISNSTES